MGSADVFYPGFEHAGLETPVDRVLTWTCCTGVLIAATIGDVFAIAEPRRRPEAAPVFDA